MMGDAAFTFYQSYYESIQEIEDPLDKLAVYEAMCRYAIYGEEPELKGITAAIFKIARHSIDSSMRSREQGKNGGRPTKRGDETPVKTPLKTPLKTTETETKTETKTETETKTKTERDPDGSSMESAAQGGEKIPAADIDEIVAEWNKLPAPVAKVKSVGASGDRSKLLRARIKEYGTAEVIAAIREVARSDFLTGKNGRGWLITFDWFVKPTNFQKVRDGNYRNKEDPTDGDTGESAGTAAIYAEFAAKFAAKRAAQDAADAERGAGGDRDISHRDREGPDCDIHD